MAKSESYVEAGRRIARTIRSRYTIKTKEDFLTAYSDYMQTSPKDLTTGEQKVLNNAKREFKFKEPREKPLKAQQIRKEDKFNVPSRKSGKIVLAKKTIVTIKGKKIVRFRDRKGQFVSVKK